MEKYLGVIVGVVLLASMLVGYGSEEPEKAKQESIAAIEKLGGKFKMGGTRLDLDNTKITDAGLAYLEGMTGLKKLGLSSTKVTDAGVKKLKAALPKCEIKR